MRVACARKKSIQNLPKIQAKNSCKNNNNFKYCLGISLYVCVCLCVCECADPANEALNIFSSCTKNFTKLIVRFVVVFFTVPSICQQQQQHRRRRRLRLRLLNEFAVCLPRLAVWLFGAAAALILCMSSYVCRGGRARGGKQSYLSLSLCVFVAFAVAVAVHV